MAPKRVVAAFFALLALPFAAADDATPFWTFVQYGASRFAALYQIANPYGVPIDSLEAKTPYFASKADASEHYNGSDAGVIRSLATSSDAAAFFATCSGFYAVNGTYTTRYLTDGPLETYSGQVITVTQERPSLPFVVRSPTGQSGEIIESNVWAGNSVIHFLDSPIFPVFPPYFNATS